MSISFESAVETLKIMFPGWDEDTLSAILVSNNYHVENTIETVLSMSGEEETPSSAVTPMSANSAPLPPQPSTGNLIDVDGSPTTKHSQSSMDSSAAVGKPPASLPTPSSSSSSNSSSSQYRGLRVELPFDFLRPPGWVGSEQTIADEDLARMLQNEMFQQEAMRVEGGAELIAMMQRSNAQNRLRQQQQQQHHRHQQQQQHPSSINSNTQRRPSHPASASATAGHSNEPVDLGIMKALNTMGTATKQSLSQLAQAFKSKTPAAASSSSSDSDIHSSSTSGGNAATSSSSSSSPQQSMIRSPSKQPKSKRGSNTFQSLDDQEINHEDIYGDNDNVEVITFGSPSSNQHMLHGADDVNGDDDDAENPLLRQRGVYNNDNVNLNKKSY